MAGYLALRAVHGALVVLAITTIVFFALQLTGDPAAFLISPNTTAEELAALRTKLGLDGSVFEQYFRFARSALTGDFGVSFRQGEPAVKLVLQRLPATLELAAAAAVITILIGIPLGMLAAVAHRTWLDRLLSTLSLLGQAIPVFWLGLILILVFAVQFHLLPAAGRGTLAHLVLPAVALGGYAMARVTRVTRSSLIEALNQDYVRTARAKGVSFSRIVNKHALRNASIPVLTVAAIELGTFLGGSIITETIFSWPGLGRLMIQSIQYRDFPTVLAGVFFFSVVIILINILVDVFYTFLDPRITYR